MKAWPSKSIQSCLHVCFQGQPHGTGSQWGACHYRRVILPFSAVVNYLQLCRGAAPWDFLHLYCHVSWD